jgi:NADPH-dependent 2,4-dienoyl-CoA reductase/sulfur reductase-like enzyme
MPNRVLIIGGGVAAMRCALELRGQDYDGGLRMVSAEASPPYDRTLVSKELLSGHPVDDRRLRLAADACPTRAIAIAESPGERRV